MQVIVLLVLLIRTYCSTLHSCRTRWNNYREKVSFPSKKLLILNVAPLPPPPPPPGVCTIPETGANPGRDVRGLQPPLKEVENSENILFHNLL